MLLKRTLVSVVVDKYTRRFVLVDDYAIIMHRLRGTTFNSAIFFSNHYFVQSMLTADAFGI
jgi:hypothetical protein